MAERSEAANRLSMVGVDKVAGFSLNVANFYTTEGEVRYAQHIRSELSKLGITDSHFVIDIGRNGAGPQKDNLQPAGGSVGTKPRLFQGGELDGLLWIMNPGETDGPCRGGPNRVLGACRAEPARAEQGLERRVLGALRAAAAASGPCRPGDSVRR